jgi:aminoglycoside phosphotransferase (APT) family kinase protein
VSVSGLKPVDEAAGGSNGTLLFHAAWTTVAGASEAADLVLRFLPARGLFHSYDVKAQFEIQRALALTSVPAARQRWLDEHGEFLGVPGYVMDRVVGRSTPMTWMVSGLYVDASPQDRRAMQLAYVAALANIHRVDWRARGLEFMTRRAIGERPIARETQWYWDSLEWCGDTEYLEPLRPIRDWLIDHEPKRRDSVLCHGDTNFGNYLFDGTRISAVVDWEMAFIGHPECDVAMFIVGNESLQGGVARPPGTLSDAEFIAEYERVSGLKLQDWSYYELFASYRSTVITVLARQHFEGEFLKTFNAVARRSIAKTLERGAALGAA